MRTSINNVTPSPAFLFALIPVISFCAQYYFSRISGTEEYLFKHNIVCIADWILVFVNYFSIKTIDWSRGGIIFVSFVVSTIFGVLAHAYWQHYNIDGGHMITPQGVVLPAGWVHLVFTIVEATTITLFSICRKKESSHAKAASIFIFAYFAMSFVFGYFAHKALTIGDSLLLVCGFLIVLQTRYYKFLPEPIGSRDVAQ